MKLNQLNVIVAALILISMSIICHLSNYLNPKDNFYNTNILYNLDQKGCVLPPPYVGDTVNNNVKQCQNYSKDPCRDVLTENHWGIPNDVSRTCKGLSENGDDELDEESDQSEQLLSDEDYDRILKEYAFDQSRRLDNYPWFH